MLFQLCLTKMLAKKVNTTESKMNTIFDCRDCPKMIVIDVLKKKPIKKTRLLYLCKIR